MGYRSFKDSTGADWHAWDVVPQLAERRVADRRQARQSISFRDRRRAERRIMAGRRSVLASGLAERKAPAEPYPRRLVALSRPTAPGVLPNGPPGAAVDGAPGFRNCQVALPEYSTTTERRA